jgi:iron complex transport system substrate-binding protein
MLRPALLLALMPLVVGCKPQNQQDRRHQKQPAGGIQVEDDLGNKVVLRAPARTIASLSPSNTEILFAVGCGRRIVLRNKLSSYPKQVLRVPATNAFLLSPEHVAGFSPDLVLLSHADQNRVAALRRIGLAVATFDPRGLEAMLANITAIGKLCGAQARAATLIKDLRARIASVRTAVKGRRRPTVYMENDGTDPLKPWTSGRGSFVDQLITVAGGDNIMGQLNRPYAQISAEEVFARNPDVIVVQGQAEAKRLRGRVGWSKLRAVRDGRVATIHADLLSRPGPRLIQGLELLARSLHPKAFGP